MEHVSHEADGYAEGDLVYLRLTRVNPQTNFEWAGHTSRSVVAADEPELSSCPPGSTRSPRPRPAWPRCPTTTAEPAPKLRQTYFILRKKNRPTQKRQLRGKGDREAGFAAACRARPEAHAAHRQSPVRSAVETD